MRPHQIQRGASMRRGESMWGSLIWTVSSPWKVSQSISAPEDVPWAPALGRTPSWAGVYGAEVCALPSWNFRSWKGDRRCMGMTQMDNCECLNMGAKQGTRNYWAPSRRPLKQDHQGEMRVGLKGGDEQHVLCEPPGTTGQVGDDFYFCRKILMLPPISIF